MKKADIKTFKEQFITDLKGDLIEVTDIDKAIEQAEMHCSMDNPYNMEINGKRVSLNVYHADILEKLKALKALDAPVYKEDGAHLIPVHINKCRDDQFYWDWSSDAGKWIRGNPIPENLKRMYKNPRT